MALTTLALAILLAASPCAAPAPAPRVVAVVLGTAQDGGVPQANCRCPRCAAARADPARRRAVASLALLDLTERETFLIDVSPDLPDALERLAADPELPLLPGRTPLAGVLLTHAHVGHYAGLIHFGREVLASRALPLYATDRMAGFLETNAPWSELVRLGHVCPVRIEPGRTVELTPHLRVTALLVPHRDELSDTVAFLVEGPTRRLLWLPDIDRWERWDRAIEDVLDEVDYAFLDATFHSPAELPGRNLDEIPHPLVTATVDRIERRTPRPRAQVFLVHLNHSNGLLGPDPAPRRAVESAGIEVAEDGTRLDL
jgi:pyrroloquinoline quinone biosynthesis protein B